MYRHKLSVNRPIYIKKKENKNKTEGGKKNNNTKSMHNPP